MNFRNCNPIFHGWYLFFRRRTFKAGVTRIANQRMEEPPVKIWQRSFYDRIIRNEESLQAVRSYIHNNPLVWWQKRQEQGEWLLLSGAMYGAPTGFMDDNVLRRTQPSAQKICPQS